MHSREVPFATARVSTRDFPVSERMAALREIIARRVQVEIEPQSLGAADARL